MTLDYYKIKWLQKLQKKGYPSSSKTDWRVSYRASLYRQECVFKETENIAIL